MLRWGSEPLNHQRNLNPAPDIYRPRPADQQENRPNILLEPSL